MGVGDYLPPPPLHVSTSYAQPSPGGKKGVVNKISKKGLSLNLRDSKGSGSSFDSRFWLEKKKSLGIRSGPRLHYTLKIVQTLEGAQVPTSFSLFRKLPGPQTAVRGLRGVTGVPRIA